MDDDYISYTARKEMEAIVSWYQGWKENERLHFLKTLKTLVQPSIDDLLGVMGDCKIENNWSAPNVFACQMKLLCDWFRMWDAEERSVFQIKLRKILDEREKAFLL